MSEPPLIEIQNATIWNGSTCVFRDFSLTIGQHERVAVLGPNGSGKTTFLKTIDQQIRPVVREDSWIRILGQERWNVWDLRSHIGLVSHDLQTGFAPGASAFEVVISGYFSSIGLYDRAWAKVESGQRDHVEEVMLALGIWPLAKRAYRTLSTGQQRRCLLARALVHDPHTLVFDEPTSGLDMAASFDFLARISDFARRGRSLLWVTHHLNDMPREIERVILLKGGAVVADGQTSAVLTDEILSEVFEVPVRVTRVEDHFLAWPDPQQGKVEDTRTPNR